jgi:hypothetical protein
MQIRRDWRLEQRYLHQVRARRPRHSDWYSSMPTPRTSAGLPPRPRPMTDCRPVLRCCHRVVVDALIVLRQRHAVQRDRDRTSRRIFHETGGNIGLDALAPRIQQYRLVAQFDRYSRSIDHRRCRRQVFATATHNQQASGVDDVAMMREEQNGPCWNLCRRRCRDRSRPTDTSCLRRQRQYLQQRNHPRSRQIIATRRRSYSCKAQAGASP